jgi:hypothetical protein
MELKVIKSHIGDYHKALAEIGDMNMASAFDSETHFWGSSSDRVAINLNGIPDKAASLAIRDAANANGDLRIAREANLLHELAKTPAGTVIKSLAGFMKGVEAYIADDLQRGWLYKLTSHNVFMPYLVTKMTHTRADPSRGVEANVTINFDISDPSQETRYRGSSNNSVNFSLKAVHGSTVPQILASKGFFKENDDLYNNYMSHINAYEKYVSEMGKQFLVTGPSSSCEGLHSETIVSRAVKMVNDESTNERKNIKQTTSIGLLNGVRTSLGYMDDDDAEELEMETFEVPFHPYIKMYSLEEHKECWVLAAFLTPYEYDKELGSKLILPEDHYDLIDILVNDADVVLDDIVADKSGGTNILCKGPAGLGKTLTAEVYSEVVGKPLYSVHSGHLGDCPENIDKRLKNVLDRASRWGAILLLDEADVYIRKRENCMTHNAIVAAFLRQLERFEGIIFLTTNRKNDVDDAIASRCIAIISYDYPESTKLADIWRMLSKHYNLPMSEQLIAEVVSKLGNIGGRDVKELLKLAYKYHSRRNSPIDFETFRKCAMFRGISASKK